MQYLAYDGVPIFVEPEKPAGAKKRLTVAERARGMRTRVLPTAADEELDEEASEEIEEQYEEFE